MIHLDMMWMMIPFENYFKKRKRTTQLLDHPHLHLHTGTADVLSLRVPLGMVVGVFDLGRRVRHAAGVPVRTEVAKQQQRRTGHWVIEAGVWGVL